MIELAEHYDEGPVHIGEIAIRQGISVKYLEQLIIPLKKAHYVKSVRGRKGGHTLARPPEEITVGEIVELLEGGINLSECVDNPDICDRSETCRTRAVWKTATGAMYRELNAITLSDMTKSKRRRPVRRSKDRKKSARKK